MINGLAKDYLKKLSDVMEKVSLEDFENIVGLIYDTYERRNTIFIMGNGGSASTASHFACDIN